MSDQTPSHPHPPDLLAPRPLPDLAEALRSRVKPILAQWKKLVVGTLPHVTRSLSGDDLEDHLPDILNAIADALESDDPGQTQKLMERSPSQGITRFQQNYSVGEVAIEDRLLRRVIVEQVAEALGRGASVEEEIAVHAALDIMLQQSVVAYVEHQSRQLRQAAEAELQYLSFLSHDISNGLGSLLLWLKVLRLKLDESPGFTEEVAALDTAESTINGTLDAMGRLLQAERLRHQNPTPPATSPVNLPELVSEILTLPLAAQKGMSLRDTVPSDAVVSSDRELIRLVLQNLVGNAVKYSQKGTVTVSAVKREDKQGGWVVSVSDEGPGIAAEHQDHIFEAFRRGEVYGQRGIGLGLAIASRAAKLLGAELTVESKLGIGSAFNLVLLQPRTIA